MTVAYLTKLCEISNVRLKSLWYNKLQGFFFFFFNTHKMSMFTYASSKLARNIFVRIFKQLKFHIQMAMKSCKKQAMFYVHQQHHDGDHSISSIKANGLQIKLCKVREHVTTKSIYRFIRRSVAKNMYYRDSS